MLDAAVEKTLAQLAQPARPSARTERTVGDPIRTLRAVLAEKECALSPPPGRWAAQAPDTHHATLMYFVGLWALHGARAAGPNKKATQRGRGRPKKEQPVAGWLPECGAGAARTATARPAPDDAAVSIAQSPVLVHICATGAWPKASGSTATATALALVSM